VVAPDRDGAVAALRAGSGGRGRSDGSRAVAFLFPGQGAQYAGMGHGLYTEEPAYRVALDQAAAAFLPHLGFDLRDVVHGGDDEALARTAVTQPALFAVSWSVAQWLLAHGVRPDALVGHSVGEFVAAQLAGVFTLEDAAALVAARGRRMMAMAPGAMLAVSAPAEGLSPPDGVEIAAVNHPDACVVAGPADAVRAYATALARDGVTARELRTSHAFHSASMDEASVAFARDVAQVGRSAPTLPFLSNVTGGWIRPADAVDPAYWGRQMRAPVRFADGAAELLRDPTRLCVEVGPGRTLAQLVRSHPRRSADQGVVTTLRHPRERDADQATALGALGACWAAGGPVPDLFAGEERRTVVLPTYPFERKRHWVEPLVVEAPRPVSGREPVERWGWAPVWEQRPRPAPRDPRSTWFAGDPAVARALGGTFAPEPLGEAPPARVVWAVPEGDPLEGALFGPLAWVRAFVTRFPGAPVELCLVTTGAADVLGTEVLVPGRAAVAGPVRVLPLEVAGLTARWIDVDGLDALADELRDGDAPEVALRGRRRWVRGHARVTPPAAEVRPGSTWLVTGGAGGVGAAIAGWLGARGANLVLVGRTLGVPSGPTVEGVAADVSTDAGAEAAVRAALARFGGLHGVVHAAGVPGGRLALRDDREVAERVLAPKVSGLAALERALRGLELDHLVLCSSLTAEVALPGQVDYVAANAVLDATAAARARDGLPWVSIGWDAWGEVGMAARAAEPDGDAAPALAFRAQMMRDAATTTEALSWFCL
ncbi:MAG: SDR family NAD(P)-dependent oxidoreductase, partial [Myxococcota bacterium]